MKKNHKIDALKESSYLNASTSNRKHLQDSLKELNENSVIESSLDKLY